MVEVNYDEAFRTAIYLSAEWGDMLPEALPVNAKTGIAASTSPTLGFYKSIIEAAKPFLPNDSLDFLDIGSATGRILFEVATSGWPIKTLTGCEAGEKFSKLSRSILGAKPGTSVSVFGKAAAYKTDTIELPDTFLRKIRARNFAEPNIIYGKFQDLDVNNMSYNVVFCLNVVDRLTYPQEIGKFLEDTVRPKGIVCISSPFDWESSIAEKDERVESLIKLFDESKWEYLKKFDAEYPFLVGSRKVLIYYPEVLILRRV